MSAPLVGVTLPQFSDDPQIIVDAAERAETLALDSIWVFDHLWPLSGGKSRPIFEAWSALAYLAAATHHTRIGTLVTRSSLRHPAVLAKTIATTAALAPARLTVGIGSGDEMSRAENEAFGAPHWGADDRTAQLISTVEVIRSFLTTDEVNQEDEFVEINKLPPSPRIEHAVPVWIAGRSDDALEAAALVADGWNGWGGTPKGFARDAATVLERAGDRNVEITWAGQVAIAATDAEVESKMRDRNPRHFVAGTPQRVAERLRGFVDAGATHVICTAPDASDPSVFELIAQVRDFL